MKNESDFLYFKEETWLSPVRIKAEYHKIITFSYFDLFYRIVSVHEEK